MFNAVENQLHMIVPVIMYVIADINSQGCISVCFMRQFCHVDDHMLHH